MEELQILIVDDQPDNSDTIMQYLNESGERYKFLQAMNGKMACKVAEKRVPDLIILDWEMPEMNGYDALVSIKNSPVTTGIPVIMATGRSSGADLDKALSAGAADYIRKPIEKQELLARVRTCLQLSKFVREIKLKNAELRAYDHMVSHDLRGPIGSMYQWTELLQLNMEGNTLEENQEAIQNIRDQCKRAIDLINGILEFASAEKELEFETNIDLQKILNEAVEAHHDTVTTKNAKIEIRDLPTIEKGISVKIYQLFYNLIGNALKFQKEDKTPVIDIYGNGDKEIVVEDNGIGFEQSKAEEIFKPLNRLTNSFDGYGIGLGTCKRIVDIHDWNIRAESELNQGTKFIISI